MDIQEQSDFPRELTRREHQQILARRAARRRRRRLQRLRRIRLYKSILSLRFWSRVGLIFATGLCIAFWARFAFVYDIPSSLTSYFPSRVAAYVTVKPWWFGPPVFDVAQYEDVPSEASSAYSPYEFLILQLGRYQAVVSHPQYIWTLHASN